MRTYSCKIIDHKELFCTLILRWVRAVMSGRALYNNIRYPSSVWLFKLKQNWRFGFLVLQATFQVLNSYVWLVVTVLDSTVLGHLPFFYSRLHTQPGAQNGTWTRDPEIKTELRLSVRCLTGLSHPGALLVTFLKTIVSRTAEALW